MAWPNDPCPPPTGPTALQHLEWIRARAQAALGANPALLNRIQAAINACKGGRCETTGSPPPDPVHGQRVLWARCLAAEGQWPLCANELEHGV